MECIAVIVILVKEIVSRLKYLPGEKVSKHLESLKRQG
jgi:hypothetical protein